jgi:hypothetical protein
MNNFLQVVGIFTIAYLCLAIILGVILRICYLIRRKRKEKISKLKIFIGTEVSQQVMYEASNIKNKNRLDGQSNSIKMLETKIAQLENDIHKLKYPIHRDNLK